MGGGGGGEGDGQGGGGFKILKQYFGSSSHVLISAAVIKKKSSALQNISPQQKKKSSALQNILPQQKKRTVLDCKCNAPIMRHKLFLLKAQYIYHNLRNGTFLLHIITQP